MKTNNKSWIKTIFCPFTFKLSILFVSFASVVPYLNERMEWIYRIFMIWGVAIALYDVFTEKKMLKSRYFWVFFVFCALAGVTFLSQIHLNFMKNAYRMGYVFSYLFVLFTCDRDMPPEQVKKEFVTIAWAEIIFAFTLVCGNLFTLIFNINGNYDYLETWIPYGIYLGRLWGLCNPNTSGSINVIATMLCLLFLEENRKTGKKKHNKFLIATIILQYLNIALGQSRTSKITFVGGMVLYLLFVRQDIRDVVRLRGKTLVKWVGMRVAFVALILCADAVILPVCMKTQSMIVSMFHMSEEATLEERQDEIYENVDSATNGRSILWKAGLKVWEDHKLLGVGFINIYEYGQHFVPENRLSNLKSGDVHNAYITLLVSQGILGAVCMGIFLVAVCWRVIAYLFCGKNLIVKILCLQMATIMVGEMAESRIIYGKGNLVFCFWIFAGYLMYYLENWRPGRKEKV